jgi:uncharacterized secreted protein with C-terminal beta-propeller domain
MVSGSDGMPLSSTTKFGLAIGIVMALILPAIFLIPHNLPGPKGNGNPPLLPPPDQPSQPMANQASWEEYIGQGGEWQTPINKTLFTRNVTLEELRVLAGEEAERALNGSASSARPSPPGYGLAEDASGAVDQSKSSSGTTPREVEEADIVKLQGSYLYVLNPYRGLIIVDLSDKDHPAVAGAARVQGYPQEMFIVGNLSFIILSASYGYWYNYYSLAVADRSIGSVSGGVEVTVGTHIAVVNLKNKAAPRLVMNIPLPGFASDSRRVGDVIYAVTNSYAWTGYGSDNGGSYITSVDFSTPSDVRRVGTLFFNGTSNQVHASSTAFFLAQPHYDYSQDYSNYSTIITYIDISDPNGAINSRGTFKVAGTLSDKYQMDHYQNTFRIVTHFWGSRGELGSSTLSIYDVSAPDSIRKIGSLDIKDAGTLMATRFAQNRAYTIHLPRAIDPLDVIDLSDPRQPRLTDVLEMPGWVTHIEVRGNKLLALGVDDSDGKTNVAVSLFDVTNPFSAMLKARVRIGSGYTWSLANWEPKALTVVDEQNIVIVPFSSYSSDYTAQSIQGIQIVEFDLEKGTLAARGMISNTEPVTRTRAYGDRVLATSDYALQLVDTQDLAHPKVIAKIQFVWNIQDAIRMGGVEVQLYSEGWEGATGVRIVRPGANDWDRPLSLIAVGLSQISLFPDGNVLYVVGVDDDELKLFAYELTDPSAPKPLGSASRKLPASPNQPDYGIQKGGAEGVPSSYYYYSLNTVILDGKVLCVIPESYSGGSNMTLYLFDLSVKGLPQALPDYAIRLGSSGSGEYGYYNYYASGFMGSGRTLYFSGWNDAGGYLGRIDLTDARDPRRLADAGIKGQLVGAEPDGSAIYTTTYIYRVLGNASQSGYTFNIYKPQGEGLKLAFSVEFNETISSARIFGGKAYLTLSQNNYYYGYDIMPGIYGEDVKGGFAPAYQPPRTTLIVLDLKAADGPALSGKIGLDGYASIVDVSGATAYITGEGMLAAYKLDDSGLHFAGALAMRGYVQKLRPFDGGALISEGLYGTETLVL